MADVMLILVYTVNVHLYINYLKTWKFFSLSIIARDNFISSNKLSHNLKYLHFLLFNIKIFPLSFLFHIISTRNKTYKNKAIVFPSSFSFYILGIH